MKHKKLLLMLALLLGAVSGVQAAYYIVGNFTDGKINKDYKMVQIISNENEEYAYSLYLTKDCEFWVENGYMSFPEDKTPVKVDKDGFYTVHFRPHTTGEAGWLYGYIKIEEAEPSPHGEKATKIAENTWVFVMPDYSVDLEVEYCAQSKLSFIPQQYGGGMAVTIDGTNATPVNGVVSDVYESSLVILSIQEGYTLSYNTIQKGGDSFEGIEYDRVNTTWTFPMPDGDVSVLYGICRNLSYMVTATMGDGTADTRIAVTPNGDSYLPVGCSNVEQVVASFIEVKDNLESKNTGQNVYLTYGTDYDVFVIDSDNESHSLENFDFAPGTYCLEVQGKGNYKNKVQSNSFVFYALSDLTFDPSDTGNILITVGNETATPVNGKIEKVEAGTDIKVKANTTGYKLKNVEVNVEGAGSNVAVVENNGEFSFSMPLSNATVLYKNVRDMTIDVTATLAADRIRIAKDGDDQFQLVESNALTPTVTDNIGTEAITLNIGTDFTTSLEQLGDDNQWTAVSGLSIGTFRLAVTGKGEYGGTIYTAPFILYQKHITKQPVAKTELVYIGQPIVLIEAAECEGGEMRYSTDGQNWTADLPTGTDAGSYNVYYKVVADENDDDPDCETLEGIFIGQAEAELAYENVGGLFATVDDPFTVPTLTNPHELTVSYSSGDEDIATVSLESGEVTAISAGEVTITATFAGNKNYQEGSAQYTLTVTDKRTLRAEISNATTFYDGIKDNDYYAAINAAICDAIAAAETVNGNTTATQAAIDQASDDIAAAYQQALADQEVRNQLIVECTTPELTAVPGEKIALKVNISSGVAPFTVSWTDTKGKPVDDSFSTSVMDADIAVSTIAAYSGTYTVTVIDAQQKVYTGESRIAVEGQPLVASFDDLALDDESYHNGRDCKGFFISGGYRFETGYLEDENGSYAYGFAYSSRTSSTFTTYAADRYNSCVGGGAEDSPRFAVFKMDRSHPMGIEVLGDDGDIVSGFYITNAASTYQAIQEGTDLARQFGKGDWLKVTVTGIDAQGVETGSVDYYLADFRDPNAAYIVETWRWVDLTELGKVKRLVFTMSGSDVNPWGSMNTPDYFCLDKLGGEKPEYEEPLLTSICLLETHRDAEPVAIYNVNGMQLPELRVGINIVKYADGTIKKILVK